MENRHRTSPHGATEGWMHRTPPQGATEGWFNRTPPQGATEGWMYRTPPQGATEGWIHSGRRTVTNFFNWFLARRQGADIYDDEKAGLTPGECCIDRSADLSIHYINQRFADGRTPLTSAIRSRDLEQVSELLLMPQVDVNYMESEQYSVNSTANQTPLSVATKLQELDIMQLLLEAGASTDITDSHGYSPLYYAAESGNVEGVTLLLKFKPHLSSHESQYDPLHTACRNGHLGVVKMLVEAGCNLDPPKCSVLISPLHLAISNRNEDIALYLLQNDSKHQLGHTHEVPLQQACWSGCDRVVSYLIDNGTDINASTSSDSLPPLFYAIRTGDFAWTARKGKACHGDEIALQKVYDDFREVLRQSLAVIKILCEAGGILEQAFGQGHSVFTPLCQTLRAFNIPASILLMIHGAQWDDTCDSELERSRFSKLKDIDPGLYTAMHLLMDHKRSSLFQSRQSRDYNSLPVPSLKHSCRLTIRKCIVKGRRENKSILPLIRTLPLPKLLIEYLCYSDINLGQMLFCLTDSFFNFIISTF